MRVGPYNQLIKWIKSKSAKEEPDEDRKTKAQKRILDYHIQELRKVRHELGETVEAIILRDGQISREKLFDALELLCSWKRLLGGELNDTEEMVFALRGLEAEVMNGGFHQYFFNSTGDHWQLHLRSMKDAGDIDGASRFQNVLAVFPDARPAVEREKRWRQLEDLGEKGQFRAFGEFDSDFYSNPYPDWDKVWDLIKSRQHEIQPFEWPAE